MRRLVWAALALWLVGCGGRPEALKTAEDALDRGDYDAAERAFARTRGDYLTPREREQVKAGRKRIAEAKVLRKVRAAERTPGREGLKALADVRKWYWQNGGDPGSPGDQAAVKAMARRIEALWPAAEAPKAQGHFVPALDGVAALMATLGRDAPKALRDRRAALEAAGRAVHKDRAQGDRPLGLKALHQGVLARLGGSEGLPAIGALKASLTVGVQSTAKPGGAHAAFTQGVARGAQRSGQLPVAVTVDITALQGQTRTRSFQEPYTWIEKVPYQVTKRVRVGSERVLVEAKTCSNKSTQLRPNGRGGYDKYEVTNRWDCSVYQNRERYEDRVITKYRDVPRKAVRTTTEETNTVTVRGSATVSFPGRGPVTVALSDTRKGVDTRYATPHGRKGIAPAKTVAGLTGAARRALAQRILDAALAAVKAHRLATWRTQREAAQGRGDADAVEDLDVRIALVQGKPDRGGAERLKARYGIDPGAVSGLLAGKRPTYAEAAWRATGADRTQRVGKRVRLDDMDGEGILERGYTLGTAGFGLSRWTTPDLPVQAPREGYGFTMRMDYPVLTAAADMREGFVVQDNLLIEFSVGARTSEGAPYTSQEEGPLALGARLGYQLQVGYRGDYLGLLAGARTEGVYTRIGDFQARDSVHALVGTLELKFWDRNPMVLQAYGLPFWGDGDVLGGSFDVTLAGNHGLGLRLERWALEARYGGNAPTDVIDLDKQQVLSADVMYLLRF